MKNIIPVVVNILLTLFTPVLISGQGISFSIQGNFSYTNPDEYNLYNGDSTYFYQFINDTTAIRKRAFYESLRQLEYATTPGFNFIPRIHLNLNKRFSLNIGIGMEYLVFNRKEDYIYSRFNLSSANGDTVALKIFIDPTTMDCDVHENSISDLPALKDGLDFTFVNLLLPVALSYQIIPGKLTIDAGLFLQTPLYGISQAESIVLKMRTENGKNICRYEIRTTENKNINANNASLCITGSIGYRFVKNLSLNFGIHKTLNNLFNSTDVLPYTNANNFSPMRFTFGLQYHFGLYIKAMKDK